MDKAIFDRSIFHGNNFHTLKDSDLVRCVEENKLKIFFTPRLIVESSQYFHKDGVAFKEQWKFLTKLNRTEWFKEPDAIVAVELGSNIRPSEYFFKATDEIQKVIDGVDFLLRGQYSQPEYQATLKIIEQNRLKRQQFSEARRHWRKYGKSVGKDFDKYFESEVEKFIQNDFMKKHSNSSEYLENWRTNRHACVFTETYIRSQFALVYLATTNTNRQPKIGENDAVDAEQSAYLIWSDIIVSDDTKFMRACFELLYTGKGKKFMTLPEFLKFLESKIYAPQLP